MKEKVSTVMGVVMPLMLAVLLVMNIFTLVKVNDVQSFINKKNGDGDVAQENDVTIGDQYVIKDTTAISDAYKSGSTSGLSDKEKETLDLAKNVLDDIITDGMTDYEKELAVYDWMTKNLTFDSGSLLVVPESGSDCDNPYGVLKYHDAVCVGYATTFRLFMQMMDIECMVVHNSDLSHSWDIVKLDGHWYHTDIYSDEGTGNYMSFNVNDSIWSQRQEWNKNFFPAADGVEYNYAYINREKVKDIYEIPKLLHAALEENKGMVSFEFKQQITDSEAREVAYMIESIEESFGFSEYGVEISTNWLPADDSFVLCIYIQGNSDDYIPDVPDIDEAALEKITKAVSDAFGDTASIDDDDELIDDDLFLTH